MRLSVVCTIVVSACAPATGPTPAPPAPTSNAMQPVKRTPVETTTPVPTDSTHEAELERLMTQIAQASGDEQREMGEALALPDASAFFRGTFGPELGNTLATEYGREAAKLGTIGSFFEVNRAKGRTRIFVEVLHDADDENANGFQQATVRAMVRPIPIYTVNLVEPEKTIGASLWSFVYLDGKFRYLGKLRATKPDGVEIDELSIKHLKEALQRKSE